MADAEVKDFLKAYSEATNGLYAGYTEEKFDAYAENFSSSDMILIRPSGNPFDMKGFKGMWSSGQLKDASSELVSVDSVRFSGLFGCLPASLPALPGAVCVATYTTHDVFTFGETKNDDIAKFSAVLEKGIKGWRIVHAHRATGQPPKAV